MAIDSIDFEMEILPQLNIQGEYEKFGARILESPNPSKRIRIAYPYVEDSPFKACVITEEGPRKGTLLYKENGGKLYKQSFLSVAVDFLPNSGGNVKYVYEYYTTKTKPPLTAGRLKAAPKVHENDTSKLMNFNDNVKELKKVIKRHGWEIGEIIFNNRKHRFDTNKPGDEAGEYIAYRDGDYIYCEFGSFKEGRIYTWPSQTGARTEKENILFKKFTEQTKQKRLEDNAKAKKKAQYIWDRSNPAPDNHPYLKRKGVKSIGLRIWRNDTLVIPVFGKDGSISSLQLVRKEGKKIFLKNGVTSGGSFTISGNDQKILCEGYATAASIHEATDATVIMAFSAHNLTKVAEPGWTIAGDNDAFTTDHEGEPWNPGREKALASAWAHNCKVVIPEFINAKGKPTDFNDLHMREGGYREQG